MRDIEIQSERTTITLSSDRFEISPWGLAGGGPGKTGGCFIVDPDGSKQSLPSKISRRIKRGQRLVSLTPGGGTRGNPFQRSPEAVRFDVLEELISLETAREQYGVVLREDLSVDFEATRQLREQRGQGTWAGK